MLELLIVAAVVALLSVIGILHLRDAALRAKVVAVQEHLRQVSTGLDLFQIEAGAYPQGVPSGADDPMGILAGTALAALTTPVTYVAAGAFKDQFGPTREAAGLRDPLAPPLPDINPRQYLLYFWYQENALLPREPWQDVDGYAVVSIGPDRQDSLIAYYPFPETLPGWAGRVGIGSCEDSIYDPSNGLRSSGDLARFGGAAQRRGCCVGGGD